MDKEIEKELRKSIKESIKKIPPVAWFMIPLALSVCFFVFTLSFRMSAKSTGGAIGEGAGTIVGRAIGTIEGIADGQKEGYEAGMQYVQNHVDTIAELSGKIQEVGKLEVLVASGTFSDILKIGESPVNYAALLSIDYNAVFTVDLCTADIQLNRKELKIVLDQPMVDFISIGEIQKMNEYQKPGFVFKTGSAEAGYISADNSMNTLKTRALEKMQTDASMMKAAKDSAKVQLEQLVNAVSLSKPKVYVIFRGEDTDE